MTPPGIIDYLRAGNPCLFIASTEEDAVERSVKDAIGGLKEVNVDYGVWRSTTGLRVYSSGYFNSLPKTVTRDLLSSLQEIEKSHTPIVAVFFNVRFYLEREHTIQQIIDTINKLRSSLSTIIFSGAYLELPLELYDMITYCDFPLPTQEELMKQFASIIKEYLPSLTNFPTEKGARKALIKKAAESATGLTSLAAENALSLSLSMTSGIDLEIIRKQKEQDIKKSDVLEYIHTEESMDTLGGFGALKEWIERRKAGFTEEARAFGLSFPKGILLCGIPGTGKSRAFKVIANYLELPLLRLDMGRIFNSYVGVSEERIRTALRIAEAISPCCLALDEIDKGLAGMKTSGYHDSGVTARVMATLLTWRQETTKPVFLIGTANDVSSLPQMVYRKGRFDEVWAVDLPNAEERAEIFNIHLTKRKQDASTFDLMVLSEKSEGFTGAEIESCVEDGMFTAFSNGDCLLATHLLDAIASTKPQANVSSEEVEVLRDWMEKRARSVSGGKNAKS